jgi:hypothetical protein
MVPFGDAALRHRQQENIDWVCPSAGRRSSAVATAAFLFKRRANAEPAISRPKSLIGRIGVRIDAQKITRPGYPLCMSEQWF